MRGAFPTVVAAVVFLVSGCSEGELPTRRNVYERARAAAIAHCGVPARAQFRPLKETPINIAKNAARAEIGYQYLGTNGTVVAASQTIWLKRVARRWAFDRGYPTTTPASKSR